jgi:uncharacterized protein (TIGR01777 family)
MNILITGGRGMLGTYLSKMLQAAGHEVSHLSRNQPKNADYPTFVWNVEKQYIDPKALQDVEAIIHLAGEGIADKRWTAARKKAIIDSRVQSTALLYKALQSQAHKVSVFVAASAIGIYGDRGAEVLDEQSAAGSDFMAETCIAWEAANKPIAALGIRCPIVRIGIVLSTAGGALAKMLPSYKLRIGTYFGSGQQYYSWVHIADVARILQAAAENTAMTGIYNATAPNPAKNCELAYGIAEAKNQKALILPAPAFALRIALGEMAAVVLNSSRVLPKALESINFEFTYPELLPALVHLLR